MICNYFRAMHITIEKIIKGNPQLAHDAPGTSPEGSLKVLTSETYKRLSGDSQGTNTKVDDFFSEVIVPVLYICFCFLQDKQIFKSSKRERPRDVSGTQLQDVHGAK